MPIHAEFTNAAFLKPKPIQWLWPGHIPIGALTLIAGHPGVGKSLLAADITAYATTERPWPGQTPPENSKSEQPQFDIIRPARVIYLAAKQDLATTLYPRLAANHTDLERVAAASFTPELDDILDQLDALLSHLVNCRLVVLDPLAAYLRHLEASRGQRAREILDVLVDLADRHEVALVGLTHQSRSNRGPSVSRLTSSVALTAAARAVWTIKKDTHNPTRRLLLPIKLNFAAETTGHAFQITPLENKPEVATLIWETNPIDAKPTRKPPQPRDLTENPTDAEQWLTAKLNSGPHAAGELKTAASQDGFAWKTIQRAKSRLHIQSRLIADPCTLIERWHWLPAEKVSERQPPENRSPITNPSCATSVTHT